MRSLFPTILIVIAIVIAACGPAPTATRVVVRIHGEVAEIVRGEPGSETVLALFRGVHRWAAGDVTGDGHTEVVLLWSLPDRPPRIWVMRPGDDGLAPVWKGSSMAGIPLDMILGRPGETGTRLLVLEDRGADALHLVLYRWDAFGFRGEAWGAVEPGSLATTEDGKFSYVPGEGGRPCPVEIRGHQILVRCPLR